MYRINIDNIVKGICKMPNVNKALYDSEIDTFCKLMGKGAFAHKVSKRFSVIYNSYVFDPDTDEDQIIIHKPHEKHNFVVRRLDDVYYVVVDLDTGRIISEEFDYSIAKKVVEKGFDILNPSYITLI